MSDIKSVRSTHTVHVTFTNVTERTVDLYWVDFEGKLVRYAAAMTAGKKLAITTFVTHPWVVRDSVTGQRLCLSGQPVYVTAVPAGNEAEVDEVDDDENVGHPIHVGSLEITIHIPVFRLEEICVGFFRKHLSRFSMEKLEVNAYLMEKLANIPRPSARIYQPGQGITDE